MAKFNWSVISQTASQALKSDDYSLALKLLRPCVKHLEQEGTTKENLGWTCMILGRCYFKLGNLSKAHAFLLRSTKILHRRYPHNAAYAYWWLSLCYAERKQFVRAANAILQALEDTANAENMKGWPCFIYCTAAHFYLQGKDYEHAKDSFEKGLKAGLVKESTSSNIVSLAKYLHDLTISPVNLAKAPWSKKLLKVSYKLLRTRMNQLQAPASEQGAEIDVLFGETLKDPYRWLENIHSVNSTKWIKSQMEYSMQYLYCIPGRIEITARSNELYDDQSPPLEFKFGDYFFSQNSRDTVLRRSIRRSKNGKIVLESSSFPEHQNLVRKSISPDGEKLVYWISEKGSDWQTLYTKNLSTGKLCRGALKNLLYSSIAWKEDSSGFYYSAVLGMDKKPSIRFHKIGQAQKNDDLVCVLSDEEIMVWIGGIAEGKFLVLNTSRKTTSRYGVMLIKLHGRGPKHHSLVRDLVESFVYVGCTDDRLYFSTQWKAPLGRVVSCKLRGWNNQSSAYIKVIWREEVAETKNLLNQAFVWGDLVCSVYDTPQGDEFQCFRINSEAQAKRLVLPAHSVLSNSGWLEYPTMCVHTESYVSTTKSFDLNLERLSLKKVEVSRAPFAEEEFVTRQLLAVSKDGMQVPFYVSHKKGLVLNGDNPTILTGYGGFNHKTRPLLNRYDILWMEQGGVFVDAILRGDGKLGKTWRQQGMRETKQKTYDDFIAVAKALIRKKYTRASRLGIRGYSNGGLLTAAVLTQQPKLFGAVLIGYGLLDMLRYHKFDTASRFQAEYGCADKRSEFKYLRAYSPLHQIKRRHYPPVLIITATHDDRVNPAHSYKFAATMQRNQLSNAPILLYVEADAGHSGLSSSTRCIDELLFFGNALGIQSENFLDNAAKVSKAARSKRQS